MAENSILTNSTYLSELRYGWVPSGQDRGTLDILWSCLITVTLCCWVATHPNAGSPKDKFYHPFIDRAHLAMVGLLGPEFLLAIALGQFSSARRSVKKFKTDEVTKGLKWTYTYAFFADMGGMFLTSPDYPEGFPINAEQLHYLVKYGHVDFPDMEQMNIGERNASDNLSRFLTLWQAIWFSVIEIQRIAHGLPMTTLELTALLYVYVLVGCQICWFKKPSISVPRRIQTKDNIKIQQIRMWAKKHTHYDLPEDPQAWYRTPVDFISGPRWQIGIHWAYYTRWLEVLCVPLYSRPLNAKLWDRFPSDEWLPAEKGPIVLFFSVMPVGFTVWFFAGWNFFFATSIEQILWRVCASYHAIFGVCGYTYYYTAIFKWDKVKNDFEKKYQYTETLLSQADQTIVLAEKITGGTKTLSRVTTVNVSPGSKVSTKIGSGDIESQAQFNKTTQDGCLAPYTLQWFPPMTIDGVLGFLRNNSANQDPQMRLSLRVLIPVSAICGLYILCRLAIWNENFIAMRVQPAGVYVTVNRYMPFWGDG
ncbi:hypothetical protein QBC36DRAFT_22753 [Triangularia setosa]|uniref:Uncharacterized protein n=1 Tax=Triangularia setosa TaxID=2587417 RepID=A0AAN6W511_9PEZI|nr:hypothetical protein QBC36DRAFT_22753 [Podospora setosa]